MTPKHKHRKIFFALISIAGIILCLLIVLMIFTPRLINLETVKEKIQRQYATATGGEIEYRRINLGFFPRPHIVISNIAIKYTDKVSGTIASLRVYPKILPLLTGHFQIDAVYSQWPELTIRLPLPSTTTESQSSTPFSIETLGDRLEAVLTSLAEFKIPSIITRIRNGRIHFLRGNHPFWELQSLNGRIRSRNDTIEFTAECQSNFWENISINGRYEESGFKLESQIKLNQFRPHAVLDYFFPQSDLKMTNARTNLTLDFHTDGPKHLWANAQGSIPYMYWRRGNSELKFTDTSFQCMLQLNDRTMTLTLSQLDLKDPHLSLAGRLNIAPAQSGIQLELEGRQINVANSEKIALALSQNDQTVLEIFEILRGGDVDRVTLKAQGSNWNQLVDANRFVIQGHLVGGKIFIPQVQLNLQDVQGDATIANAILYGENIEARIGKSSGSKGKLAIALTEDTAPFHIEGLIHADLSQLPPVLNHLIENNGLKKELALLEKFEGRAVGMLVIGEDMENLNVRVTASDIHLNARYQRIPFPLSINGGNLHLDGTRITLTNLNATVGNSSLSQLSSKFSWDETSLLELSAKSANIDLAQLYGWLAKSKAFEADLRWVEALTGTVSLKKVNLKGPLVKPDQWRLQSDGEIQNLSLRSSLLPGSLNVAQGQFICEDNQLKIQNLNALVGKSSLSGLSADLQWGKIITLSAKTQQAVVFLDEVFPWLQSYATLKRYLKQIQTLTGTLAFQNLAFHGPLAGKKSNEFSLSGTIQKWDIHSPKFPTSIELAGGGLSWQNNRIDLQETNVRFGESTVSRLSLQKQGGLPSSFELKAESADIRIADLYPWLVSFEALKKMLKGFVATQGKLTLSRFDLKESGNRSKPWQLQLTGGLQDLVLESDYFKAPLQINTAKFSADDMSGAAGAQSFINLDSTHMSWEDSQMILQGKATFSPNGLLFDMQLTADRLSWGQIDQIIELGKKREPGSKMELLGSLKVESDNFTYDNYTWRALQAEISLMKTATHILIKKADLCGIQFPGTVNVSDNDVELDFNPLAENENLEFSVACLSEKKNLADGSFNLNGELISKAAPEKFPKSLTGNLQLTANQGRIYRFGMLAKIFALLNVTEIYRGEVPDLMGKGFAYNSIAAKGVFKKGKLIIKDTSIDSPSMGIAIEGDIDLIKEKVNLVVLVAPFKTVDRIVKHIPLVGTILGGTLISIPFRAIGDLHDPDVIPLSPTAVGSGLLGILERTLKLPITIIQPVLPSSKEKQNNNANQPNSP
ncbi:MAG: AsmA-like C-terminal domain-containing protein [Desulfobacterales bacterium]|jgi:hypothetical protein